MSDVFQFNLDRFRIVDLSYPIKPNEEPASRPFMSIRADSLPDGKDTEAVFTHTHVGTHIESPIHFFRKGKAISDFPLARFFGPATLININKLNSPHLELTHDYLKGNWNSSAKTGDIIVFRNELEGSTSSPHSRDKSPHFTVEAAKFIVEKEPKMIIIGNLRLGSTIEKGKDFERQIHENDIPIIEMPSGLEKLNRPRFFIMALPLKIKDLGSVWTRLIAIVKK